MSSNQKIVIITGDTPTLIKLHFKLIETLVKCNYNVTALAPMHKEFPAIQMQLAKFKVKLIPIRLKNTNINPIANFLTLKDTYRALKLEKPDVLLAYQVKSIIWSSLAARFVGIKQLYSVITGLGYCYSGTTIKQRFLATIVSSLFKLALKPHKKVLFQNPDDEAFFVTKKLVEKSQTGLINGSGVDLSHFAFTPTHPKQIIFIVLARLIYDKGVREYLQAAQQLKSKYPQVQFRLAGELVAHPNAVNRQELDHYVKNNSIEYLGKLSDVRPALVAASVCVLPSYREGLPGAIIEAMAMGRAVVTTDTPGCRETVVSGVNGYLVPIKDSKALADAMEQFIIKPEQVEIMGRASRKIAEERYDIYKIAETILAIISSHKK